MALLILSLALLLRVVGSAAQGQLADTREEPASCSDPVFAADAEDQSMLQTTMWRQEGVPSRLNGNQGRKDAAVEAPPPNQRWGAALLAGPATPAFIQSDFLLADSAAEKQRRVTHFSDETAGHVSAHPRGTISTFITLGLQRVVNLFTLQQDRDVDGLAVLLLIMAALIWCVCCYTGWQQPKLRPPAPSAHQAAPAFMREFVRSPHDSRVPPLHIRAQSAGATSTDLGRRGPSEAPHRPMPPTTLEDSRSSGLPTDQHKATRLKPGSQIVPQPTRPSSGQQPPIAASSPAQKSVDLAQSFPTISSMGVPDEHAVASPLRMPAEYDPPTSELLQGSSIAGGEFYQRRLCSKLAVPMHAECILTVRAVSSTLIDIVNQDGQLVLRAMISHTNMRPSMFMITLHAASTSSVGGGLPGDSDKIASSTVVATGYGYMQENKDSMRVFIHNATGEVVGCLARDTDGCCYALTIDGVEHMSFSGVFSAHDIIVQDKKHEKLAASEHSDCQGYTVRVSPGVDVGLVICTFIVIDEMELQSPRS